jgi:glycosyltransferase involved in cell wall biosynthesis
VERTPGTISLCAIAKNEAATIEGMIESVRGLANQIIVIDTGSTDATREIAGAAGAIVESVDWRDDFSLARNHSLSRATSEWILVLDADERIDQSQHAIIRKRITAGASAFYLQRRHYTRDRASPYFVPLVAGDPYQQQGAEGYYVTNDIRLFRNDPLIQYEGVVHETAERSIRALPNAKVSESEILIHHLGPLGTPARNSEKSRWYLSLAKIKAQEAPTDWRTWFQVGAEYSGLHQHDSAIIAFQKAVELEPNYYQPWRQLGISLAALARYSEALPALQRAVTLEPACPMTWNALGVALMKSGHLKEAELCFQTTIGLDPNHHPAAANLRQVQTRATPT